MLCRIVFSLFILIVTTPCAQAELFIKFDDIEGSSMRANRKGWSNLQTVDLHFSVDPRTNTESLFVLFSMAVDGAYPYVVDRALEGTVTDSVWVEEDLLVEGENVLLTSYEFRNTRIGDLSVSHADGQEASLTGLLESVGELRLTHAVSIEPDAAATYVTNEWKFTENNGAALDPFGALAGDYNRDGRVDQADYEYWKDQYGIQFVAIGTEADGNVDGRIGAADYSVWRDNVLQTASGVTVPEPDAIASLVVLAALLATSRRTRR